MTGNYTRQFAAVVVDVDSDRASFPSHLVTQEFWRGSRRVLAPEGVRMANLILDSRLASPYARHVLDTLESVYGRCATSVLQMGQPYANVIVNVIVTRQATGAPSVPGIYTGERHQADLEKMGIERP